MGTVDGHAGDNAGRARQSLEYLEPEPLPAPAIEAIVDRRIGAVFRRAVPPAGARAQHVDDPADHTSVVHPMRAATSMRQQGFKPPPFRSLESQLSLRRNLEGSVRSRGRTMP